MNRAIFGIAGLAIATSSASAAFLGLSIREDKSISAAAQLLLPAGARTFNIYAIFDGDNAADLRNVVLSTGNDFTFFRINKDEDGDGIKDKNLGAEFVNTGAPFGSDTAPSSGFFGFDPTLEFDSYVTIGVKDSAGGDNTNPDPSFGQRGFYDENGDGLIDAVGGGWANGDPPSLQGAAGDLGDGTFGTILAQLTIVGLDAGASVGSSNSPTNYQSDIFTGQLDVFRQGDLAQGEDPAVGFTVQFKKIPSPGALALFGIAGLAAGRRRR